MATINVGGKTIYLMVPSSARTLASLAVNGWMYVLEESSYAWDGIYGTDGNIYAITTQAWTASTVPLVIKLDASGVLLDAVEFDAGMNLVPRFIATNDAGRIYLGCDNGNDAIGIIEINDSLVVQNSALVNIDANLYSGYPDSGTINAIEVFDTKLFIIATRGYTACTFTMDLDLSAILASRGLQDVNFGSSNKAAPTSNGYTYIAGSNQSAASATEGVYRIDQFTATGAPNGARGFANRTELGSASRESSTLFNGSILVGCSRGFMIISPTMFHEYTYTITSLDSAINISATTFCVDGTNLFIAGTDNGNTFIAVFDCSDLANIVLTREFQLSIQGYSAYQVKRIDVSSTGEVIVSGIYQTSTGYKTGVLYSADASFSGIESMLPSGISNEMIVTPIVRYGLSLLSATTLNSVSQITSTPVSSVSGLTITPSTPVLTSHIAMY